ncbi:WD40 repeat-like protein [Neoconidiobolus thromboides FSU 785]|nr:WD40 repeat-like protein [Neoconidiobolus thromboides FSU 785]
MTIKYSDLQLRDLISCPGDENEIYYVNHYSVLKYNCKTHITTPVLKYLTFEPASITIGKGYLAVGGQRAQLTLRHLRTNWSVYTSVSGSINNSLSIYDHYGKTRLLVCNNDESIKIYSLPDFVKVECLRFPTAVNHASVSPDGTKLVAVGDTNEIFLYNIRGDDYQLMHVLQGSNDSGFSCAWKNSSEVFASAFQDGFVHVWDLRSTKSIAKFCSKQSPSKGAARCVKFSTTGSIDLMAFSEHMSYFNIVDARTFNSHEVVRVAPEGYDLNIAGLCFSPSSKSIFIGLENSIQQYDIDTRSRRSFSDCSFN